MIVSPAEVDRDRARTARVRSVQSAELTMARRRPRADLERRPTSRTWRAPTGASSPRVTLGLIRVVYGENSARSCCSAGRSRCCASRRPSTRSSTTTARSAGGSATACWSRARRPRLRLPVARRAPPGREATPDGRAKLRIEVEVANFYPSIAAGFSTPGVRDDPVRRSTCWSPTRSCARWPSSTSRVEGRATARRDRDAAGSGATRSRAGDTGRSRPPRRSPVSRSGRR